MDIDESVLVFDFEKTLIEHEIGAGEKNTAAAAEGADQSGLFENVF
jgi:hypothetical protein